MVLFLIRLQVEDQLTLILTIRAMTDTIQTDAIQIRRRKESFVLFR